VLDGVGWVGLGNGRDGRHTETYSLTWMPRMMEG
jgi:hypothetical protein